MKYEFIGWQADEVKNIDKVWGIICINETPGAGWALNKYVSFWGRRGKKLSTKVFDSTYYDMVKVYKKKNRDGYTEIAEKNLTEVYPEFQDDLEKTAVWALLSN